MMKKRSNDNAQLRPDEVDRLDDEEPEDIGTFTKASAEEMSTRRIVRVRKRAPTDETEAPAKSTNGFSSFSGFTSTPAASSASAPGSNPFAGFSSLAPSTATTSSSMFAGFSFNAAPPAAPVSAPPTKIEAINATSAAPKAPTTIDVEKENEYQKKVKKLNQAFLNWGERQIKDNPISVWKDGVKDYIKYQKELKEKFPSESAAQEISVDTKPKAISTVVKDNAKPEIKPVVSLAAKTESALASAPAPAPVLAKEPVVPAAFPSVSFSATPSSTAASLPTFSFGAAPAAAPAAPAPATSFGFPSSTGFSFPTSTAAPAFGSAAPFGSSSSGGFGGFGQSSFGQPTTAKKDEGEEEGGDDEGEPILEPEKILRNENDKDEILVEVNCKLAYFNKEDNEWKDKGKGSFRLTKDPDSSKKRMLVRNTMGKITFNAAFFKGMKIERHKDSLIFNAFVSLDDTSKPQFQRFQLKLKREDADQVKSQLEKCIAEM